MTCPTCGSDKAVDKSEAWDALTSIPPKTEKELFRLRQIEAAARNIALYGQHEGDKDNEVTTVRLSYLNALRLTFDADTI